MLAYDKACQDINKSLELQPVVHKYKVDGMRV